FTAKEAVVSTMTVLLGGGELSQSLLTMFTPVSAVSFLVFTLLYTPCVASIAAIKRELGSSLAAVGLVIMQCAIAWIVSFIFYRVGMLIL
ncbi:MAG: nucleoside recognition domain-containing protein, partial [Oscillospiraceae bacterium]